MKSVDIVNFEILTVNSNCTHVSVIILPVEMYSGERFLFSEQCKEKLLSSSLVSSLVDFLQSQRGDENYETVLDILIALAEWGM